LIYFSVGIKYRKQGT